MKSKVYWIEGPWSGRLAIALRPRGGEWLDDETNSWRKARIDLVVSALTKEEIREFDLADEEKLLDAKGLEYLAFPIPDRGLPGSMDKVQELVRKLEFNLAQGKNVAIHCRQGIGRSSLLAAATLVVSGVEPGEALARIEAGRECSVPDTPAQKEWVFKFAKKLGPVVKA